MNAMPGLGRWSGEVVKSKTGSSVRLFVRSQSTRVPIKSALMHRIHALEFVPHSLESLGCLLPTVPLDAFAPGRLGCLPVAPGFLYSQLPIHAFTNDSYTHQDKRIRSQTRQSKSPSSED